MKPLAFVLCCGAVLCGSACSRPQPVKAKQDSGPVPVKVAPVQLKRITRSVESVGTFYPYDETTVSAELEGRVDKVNVDLGDAVSAGQELIHISDEEQRYLLAQTEAQLRQALERLGLRNETDRLKEIREASEVRRAQADLTDAEQRYQRMRSLVEQGIGAPSDLDAASARYKAMQAAYDQAIKDVRNLIQEVERSRASLALQRKKLRDTSVRAPFAGLIKERQITPGSYVRPNAPLFTLVKTDPIRLRLEVPERMAPWIKNGQVADVIVEAFEDRHFQGKVWRISPTVDQTKRTFVVEALLPNPGNQLKPGSYARAKLPTQKTEQIKLIPAKAVVYVLGSNKAYVVANNIVEARELKLGDRFEEQVEVIEGIREGESVATTQLNRLDTGVKVQATADDLRGDKRASD